MTRIGMTLGAAGCALVLSTTACGTSHNESNATVCKKLKADAESLNNENPGSNTKAAATDIKNATKKLDSDASHAKSSQLRSAVSKATNAFNQVAGDLSNGKVPVGNAATGLTNQLKSAGQQLNAACPGQ